MKNKKTSRPQHSRPRGIYLLPNLLTTSALFAGFYAIVATMQLRFEVAAVSIFIAMIADGLDGRVARLTQTQTAFGAEYDSLSDMVAFAIAPALLVYNWSLITLGKTGWLVAFLYAAATALRLARFNTQPHDTEDRRYFQGLPCPSAAAVIAGMVWMDCDYYGLYRGYFAVPEALITCFLAGLMVSRFRYYSFKQLDMKGKVPFFTIVSVVLVLAAVAVNPPGVLASLFFIYAFSGPLVTLLQKKQKKKMRRRRHGGR